MLNCFVSKLTLNVLIVDLLVYNTMKNKLSSKVKRKTLMLFDQEPIKQTLIASEVHKDEQPIYKRARFKRTQSNHLALDIDAVSSVNVDTSFEQCGPLFQLKSPREPIISFFNLNTSRSESKLKRNLSFTPKGLNSSKKIQLQKQKPGITTRLKQIIQSLRQVVSMFRLIMTDIHEKIRQFTQKANIDFQENFFKIEDNLTHLQEKIAFKDIKANNFSEQKTKSIKIEQIPVLNFQNLMKSSETEQQIKPNKSRQIIKNNTHRQVKTQRHVMKHFQFNPSSRIDRKFSTFNQTLIKMKRLSFEGSILKL